MTRLKALSISQHFYLWDHVTVYADFRYEDMRLEGVVDTDVLYVDGLTSVLYPEPVRRRVLRKYREFMPQFGFNFSFNDSFSSHFSYSESLTSQSVLLYSIVRTDIGNQEDKAPPVNTRQLEVA